MKGLEEDLVDHAGALPPLSESAVALRALGVLVGQPEAQELRRQKVRYGSTAHSRPGLTGYWVQS